MLRKYTKYLNKIVILLTISDVFTWGPFFVISALSGIYLSNKLGSGTIEFVGVGTAIYFFTRAITQIPIGYITDKIKKSRDEIVILIFGILLMGLPYTMYPLITHDYHYYLLQIIFGVGVSLNVNNWRKLFAMNIDSGREGRQYGFYDTIMSLCTVIFSAVIGLIANLGDIYFDLVMVSSGVLMMSGSLWVSLIRIREKKKTKKKK